MLYCVGLYDYQRRRRPVGNLQRRTDRTRRWASMPMRQNLEAVLSPMKNAMRMLVHRRYTGLVLILLGVAAAGCDHGPRMYKVSGKVTFKGGPMPHAGVCTVQFIPSAGTSA